MSNGVLGGVASFGTGFMQGMNAAMQSRLDAAADRRMLKYKADLENDLRKEKEADAHTRLMKAFGPRQTKQVPPPDPNTVVTRNDVLQELDNRARQEMIPLLQSGITDERTLAAHKEKIVDRLRKENEETMMTYASIAGQQIANGEMGAAQASLAEANKYNPNGLSLIADPQSGGFVVVDEDRRTPVAQFGPDQFPDAFDMLFVPAKERRQDARRQRQEARQEAQLKLARQREARAVQRDQSVAFDRAVEDGLEVLESSVPPDAESMPNMTRMNDLAQQYALTTQRLNPPRNRKIATHAQKLITDVNAGNIKEENFAGPPQRVDNGFRVTYRGGPSFVISEEFMRDIAKLIQAQQAS